jgi:hypothetical protein
MAIVKKSEAGITIKIIPRLEDLAGIDAGKVDLEEAIKMLDKMRSEDRY